MDKKELEKLAMQMYQQICQMIRAVYPDADQISMCDIMGSTDMSVSRYMEYGNPIMDAHSFRDGDMRLENEYFRKEEAV